METARFWRRKALADMTEAEWESLCDGCARCCLVKLEDEASGAIDYTDAACLLLDMDRCRCTDYANRQARVSDCLRVTPENLADSRWLPSSCAYRLLAEGKDLPWWHPLVSGDPESVYRAGISIRYRAIRESEIADEDLPDRIVTWPR